jgi:opacity protein-like surface antigen
MAHIIVASLIIVSGVRADNFLDRFGLKLNPGGIMALGGHFNDHQKLREIANIGVGLNGGLRFIVNDYIALDLGYAFNWMAIKKDSQPFDYKEMHPAFNLQMFTLNGTFSLGSGYLIEPYLTLGAGLCPWRFSQTSLWGAAWPAPGNQKGPFGKNSFGINIGLGAETDTFLFSRCSVFVEIKYHYIYSRDVKRLGTDDFNEQDFLGLNVGLVYYFGNKQ